MSQHFKNNSSNASRNISQTGLLPILTKTSRAKANLKFKDTDGGEKKDALEKKVRPPPFPLNDDLFLTLARRKNEILEKFQTENDDIKEGRQQGSQEETSHAKSSSARSSTHSGDKSSEKPSKHTETSEAKLASKSSASRVFESSDKSGVITLTETPSVVVFENRSYFIQSETKEVLDEAEKNRTAFVQMVREKQGNDNFVERSIQTQVRTIKSKEVQAYEPETRDTGAQIFEFELGGIGERDEAREGLDQLFSQIESELDERLGNPYATVPNNLKLLKVHALIHSERDRDKDRERSRSKKKNENLSRMNSQSSLTNMFDTTSDLFPTKPTNTKKETRSTVRNPSSKRPNKTDQLKTEGEFGATTRSKNSNHMTLKSELIEEEITNFREKVMQTHRRQIIGFANWASEQSPGLRSSLLLIEKCIHVNNLRNQLLSYRLPPNTLLGPRPRLGSKPKSEQKPDLLRKLMTFETPEVEGMPLNAIALNPGNPDLIACGYGRSDLTEADRPGRLLLWTPKNPKHPEASFPVDSAVLSVRFSQTNPYLLAAGLMNGTVLVYDLRQGASAHRAAMTGLRHYDTAWEVVWALRGRDRAKGESLISVSADGKVCEWELRKNLEPTELKALTRLAAREPVSGSSFRLSCGLCLDFHGADSNVYFVGTDEGAIHRCSRSYKEQYLESYSGHSGSVYRVACNPFNNDVFLSCSADWTCRVWHAKKREELLSLKSLELNHEVVDAQWNTFCSTSFACVSRDGRLELWDFAKKNSDPIEARVSPVPMTTLAFSKTQPVLFTGNAHGQMEMFKVQSPEDSLDPLAQVKNLNRVLNLDGELNKFVE